MTRRRPWRSWARHSKRWAQVFSITPKSILIWLASVTIRGSKPCRKPLNAGWELRLTAIKSYRSQLRKLSRAGRGNRDRRRNLREGVTIPGSALVSTRRTLFVPELLPQINTDLHRFSYPIATSAATRTSRRRIFTYLHRLTRAWWLSPRFCYRLWACCADTLIFSKEETPSCFI